MCNPISKPQHQNNFDKIFALAGTELPKFRTVWQPCTKRLGVAFILKAIPKLDHLDAIFQELQVEDSRCIDGLADCSLLHHIYLLA